MKKSNKINKANLILSIFGLVLFLLLSPCKVRNFIQTELGIPQAKVLNKSQSTIFQSNCQTFDVSEAIKLFSKLDIQQPNFLPLEVNGFEFTIDLLKHSFNLSPSSSQQATGVPLYILYQNLKVYS